MKNSFYVKLAMLVIPIALLLAMPVFDESANSVGGGNYSLTKLYAGIYILVAIAVWFFLIMFNSAYFYFTKNKEGLDNNNPLLLIGIVLFLASLLVLTFTWFAD